MLRSNFKSALSAAIKIVIVGTAALLAIVFFRGVGHLLTVLAIVMVFKYFGDDVKLGRWTATGLIHASWILPLVVYLLLIGHDLDSALSVTKRLLL